MDIRSLCSQLAMPGEGSRWNRVVFATVSSTNAVAKAIAAGFLEDAHEIVPTVVMALEQTGGRGRLGRQWSSPPGGIYVSLLLPAHSPGSLSLLPMRVATALCHEIDAVIDPPCRLKWPNDLMVERAKLGGILIETIGTGRTLSPVIGFGINYSNKIPLQVPGSTSVMDTSAETPPLAELAGRLTANLIGSLSRVISMEEAVEQYASWSAHATGDAITHRSSTETCTGSFVGFDDRGFLRLATAAGERTFAAGDLIQATEVGDHVQP
jgi:BirA family biotin operon repressor/biotin-[acetyl-CoA-carboxylase] ligase